MQEDVSGRGPNGERSRAALLKEVVEKDCRQYTRWTYFWLVFYIALDALLIAGYILASKPETEHALLVGSIATALGIAGIFIHALTGYLPREFSPRGLAGFFNIFTMPLMPVRSALTASEVPSNELIAEAGRAVEERGEMERKVRHWLNRIPAFAVVGGGSLVLWLAWDLPVIAAINLAAGLLVSQTQHQVQPTAAMKFARGQR